MSPGEPVEAYLAAFAHHLGVTPRRRRRILEETENHLRDAADELVAGGASVTAAQVAAIKRFGSAKAAAASFGVTPMGFVWRQVARLRVIRISGGNRSPEPVPAAVPAPDQPPAPMCDVCGREMAPADGVVVDLSAVGHIESPLTVVAHRACFDMGEAILALLGMPVAVAGSPAPSPT
ncbi:MAG: HAAS signaling domain-containing protein [Acidimicrobiales bacterium]